MAFSRWMSLSLGLAALAIVTAVCGCSGPGPRSDGAPETGGPEAGAPGAGGAAQSAAPEAARGAAEKEGQEPEDGDWLVSRLPLEPGHLNVLLDTADAYAMQLTLKLFDTLLDRDNETLELVPLVAESYEISEDHLVYTFRLRKDVVFSDGVPLTAQDVKFTLDTIQDPKNLCADKRNYFVDVKSAEVLDDYTIRFTCSKPYFKHLEELGSLPIYPRHIYGQGDFNTHPNNRKPVGSGPYAFESWETNLQISFVRNENYWRKDKMPHLMRRVYKIITDDSAALQVFERGELDFITLMPEQWVNRVSTPEFEAKFNKLRYPAPSGYIGACLYIGWNMREPKFEDARVRRALTMLLDRQLIVDTIYYGLATVISGDAAYQSADYDKSIAPWPFDPQAAKQLLDEAGWVDTDKDGIRDKDGALFRFELLIAAGIPEAQQMATVYKEELGRAGIDMVIRQLQWAVLIDTVTKRKFDAMESGWAIPIDADPYQIWHSTQCDQGSNYPGFKSPEVDEILEQARTEFDRDKRTALYRRLHRILHEEQPYTFLFARDTLAVMDKRFRDVRIYPQGLDQTEWWVPKAEQRYK